MFYLFSSFLSQIKSARFLIPAAVAAHSTKRPCARPQCYRCCLLGRMHGTSRVRSVARRQPPIATNYIDGARCWHCLGWGGRVWPLYAPLLARCGPFPAGLTRPLTFLVSFHGGHGGSLPFLLQNLGRQPEHTVCSMDGQWRCIAGADTLKMDRTILRCSMYWRAIAHL